MNWWRDLRGKVILREPLKRHTSFKIGGPAKFFIRPYDADELKFIITLAKRYKLPISVIGNGTNVLASDRGLEAIILQLNLPFFKKVFNQRNSFNVGCGVTLRRLIQEAKERSLSGIEFLTGIPGTIGGALNMNVGAWGRDIGELVENVRIMDYNGKIKTLGKRDIRFGYRKSSLGRFIILNAHIRLIKKDKQEIEADIKKYLAYRRNAQDTSLPNAGCVFKNPSSVRTAGRLIDLCGLKGRKIGDACVSQAHANFILNLRSATATDVLKLMDLIKRRVKDKFNIILEPEIKIWQ